MPANDRQEGGSHYKTGRLQHWDLARIFKWDPMQYQITKYVMRWKDKHSTPKERLEDLKKARHFIDKYIEDYASWDDHQAVAPEAVPISAELLLDGGDIRYAIDPAKMDVSQDWQCEGWYGDNTNLYRCKACRNLIRTGTVERAIELHKGACPKGVVVPPCI